ncbi:MAG: recombinase family protein [Rubrobacteraceae bacterium]|nr:recombinase family protein [Rubrobacteraceae bacterium]
MAEGSGERVALYMRVSSEEQRERMTIGTQEEFLTGYASLYNLEVAGGYKDEGVSGTVPLHERPGGRRMLEDLHEDAFDTVLVYKLDRIGRTLLVTIDAHDRLQGAGVNLKSATEPIDTSSPAGRLIFQMLASFAEFERGTIRERTTHGLHRAYRAGKQSGRIPYGYDIGEDGTFVVVKEEAEIVRQIIANIASGGTLYSEAARLNALGIPAPGYKYRGRPRQPGPAWSTRTIHNICRQPAYSGEHRVRANGGKSLISRPTPAIVEPELQQRALKRLAENKRRYNRPTDRKYLLRGLIRCEVCGAAYVGHPTRSKNRKFYYYKCSDDHRARRNRNPKAASGHAPYLRAEWIEGLVWEDVKHFLENPGELLEKLREQLESGGEEKELQERLEDLEKRLASKQAEKDRYVRMYAMGHLDEQELAIYLEDLRNQVGNLRLLIDATKSGLAERQQQRALAGQAGTWLMQLRRRVGEIEADTPEAFDVRRELVQLLVDGVLAGRDEEGKTRVRITYRFSPPAEHGGGRFVESMPNSCEFLLPKPVS